MLQAGKGKQGIVLIGIQRSTGIHMGADMVKQDVIKLAFRDSVYPHRL